ncbi:high-affinity iron permease CaFTR1 [Cryptococcus deuterogattii 99/473]|uniref:High-affinity iron permease CaFTR1 n=1 Tax=Cryptococcus deuterogattii Ram5 TaxID=1296110 RepID=A0A0D0UXF1_9TREE|nr:high-affinity iron permease CaFTR1 [Cryptococcus deuterogattii Ram5]KIR71013.1 high-affinity iron permease CaFTR1 [Cryptococcus deuterogattii CA1014]KIR97359.1 high-affinity iron permease CaFTR1 [Cryptococcus deuterogattii 2001/935-1]KIY57841.1 high-affinity iron permease CaFTR1 [Cryptococcus deuterogattii 99/473]
MAKDVFSVPIFFIVFRETIEAAIIVSVLLSFVEQLMLTGRPTQDESDPNIENSANNEVRVDAEGGANFETDKERRAKLVRRMRIQIWAGTGAGFFISLCIGAAFIAVLWEGVFSVIAAGIIYVMATAFLKMDRSRIKWRLKLAAAFDQSQAKMLALEKMSEHERKLAKQEGRSGKWALFLLPFITLLREGLEAVVFVGGVSLGLPATSIPLAVVVGLIAGFAVGYLIYRTGSTTTLHWFLVGSTSFLCLIGAGLMSKGVGFFQYYHFSKGVGGDVAETGDGPGSFQVAGNVWHLEYGNPEPGSATTNGGWQIFNAIFGWNNTATLGTILSYVFYWILVAATLVYLKWKEGRISFFGYQSAALQRRHALREARKANEVALQNTEQYQTDEKAYNGNQGSEEGERSSEGKSFVATPVDEKHVPALERHY